jgi:UDP-3-O-[3-hydroxymyristoyl] glucosamine N-acyltransferase
MQFTLKQIASLVQGRVDGDPEMFITGPAKIEEADSGQITFLGNEKYEHYIYGSKATAIIVDESFQPKHKITSALIRVPNVYQALAILMNHFQSNISSEPVVSGLASVSENAVIGTGTSIGDFCIVKKGVSIGKNCILYGQNFIGDNVTIGDNSIIYPGVKIYHNCEIGSNCIIHANSVIGSDGFGFAVDEHGKFSKIPQTGNVKIMDHVEIGANSVIDRASMGSTLIENGVKLDNLIQIAHNVTIGAHSVIAAQTGISGSTKIGSKCMIGGQVGIVGHIEIAEGTQIQAQSGVASSVKEKNSKLYGYPALDYSQYLRSYAIFKKLPDMANQLRMLKEKLDM